MKLEAKKLEILKAFTAAHGHHYSVHKSLGDGAYGFTFIGRDKHREMDVCVKFLKEPRPRKGDMRDWQLTSKFRHELINPTFSVEKFNLEFGDETVAVVSAYVKGKTLATVLAKIEEDENPQDIRDSFYRTILIDLARAVKYLHAQGHGHGDLHSKNVILTKVSGTLKPVIIDFDNATIGGCIESTSEDQLKLRDVASLRQTLGSLVGHDDIGLAIKSALSKADSAQSFLDALEVITKIYDATSFCRQKRFSPRQWDESCRSLVVNMLVGNPCYQEIWNFRELVASKYNQTDELMRAKQRYADRILNAPNAITVSGSMTCSSDPFEVFKDKLFADDVVDD
jgi:serine/threonine protein kinase